MENTDMRRLLATWLFALLAFMSVAPANAQSNAIVLPSGCGTGAAVNSLSYLTVDSTLKLCVNATATLGGFTALTTGTPIAATTGGVSGTLPTGAEVVATNVGATNGAYCALGGTASTSSQYIAPNGGWFAFAVGASTQLTCITSTGSTTVNMTGGSGLPTGTGGGGGGGGSSSNASVSATGAAVPASATYFGMIVAGNLTGVPGTANGVKTDGSAVIQPVSVASGAIVANAYAAGALPNGAIVAQGSTTDAPCTIPATTTACSQVAIEKAEANLLAQPVPLGQSSGGWTPTNLNALSTTVKGVKASAAGQLSKVYCWNPNVVVIYVEFFDVATTGAVTLGTTAPRTFAAIPPTNAGGWALPLVGDQFTTGIQAAAVTTFNGSSAPSTALDCSVSSN